MVHTKHQTIIGDNVFVGSDVQLIAPVKVHDGATIAAGTTVTKDVAENELAISRTDQKAIPKWKRPVKIINYESRFLSISSFVWQA